MNVLAFYEHVAREVPALKILKAEFEGAGDSFEFFSIFFEWSKALRVAKAQGVDILLMPWCYSCSEAKFVAAFLDVNPDLKVVNLHHEQLTPGFLESAVLPKDEFSKNGVFHIAWSEHFGNVLTACGVSAERIVSVGNLRYGLLSGPTPTRLDLAERTGLCVDKAWIIYAESRRIDSTSVNKNMRYFVETCGIDDRKCSEYIERWRCSIEVMVEQLGRLDHSFFDHYELIYRPHPGSNIDYLIPERVCVTTEGSISDWLPHVRAFVTWQSTAAFEAEAKGVPVFVHECVKIPADEAMPGLDEYQKVGELRDLVNILDSEVTVKSCSGVFRRYIGPVDDQLGARYRSAITEFGDTELACWAPAVTPWWRLHAFVFEKVSRIFDSVGLLVRLKWPRTAFMLRGDAPWR